MTSSGYVLLLLTCFCLGACVTRISGKTINTSNVRRKTNWNPPDYNMDPRQKRSMYEMVMASFRAIKKLTDGAMHVSTRGKFMQYEKPGDMVDSLRDIHSMKLENLKFHKGPEGQTTAVTGTKGDSHFTLLPFGEDGSKPIITVRRIGDDSKPGRITHKINYN